MSMDQIIARSLVSRRFAMILLGLFAAIALVLASIGIYGVMSYVAGQQTHEIGLRMALGAQPRDVLKQVFSEAAMMVFTGVPIGLIAAGALTDLIQSLLSASARRTRRRSRRLPFCLARLRLLRAICQRGGQCSWIRSLRSGTNSGSSSSASLLTARSSLGK
jgi:ABC-type antimicrobial peptide transport system permease subunit